MTETQPVSEPKRISVGELKELLDKGDPVQILDVRSDSSYAAADRQIPHSLRIAPHDVDAADRLSRDLLVVAY